jgi:hypothetical protein
MWLTYFMVKWDEVEQRPSEQKCTLCGKSMMRTEPFADTKGTSYEGYVCHSDKQVTWVRAA